MLGRDTLFSHTRSVATPTALMLVWLCGVVMAPRSAQARKVSFSLSSSRRVQDASYLVRMARKKLRMAFLRQGFQVGRRVSQGYHFQITLSIEESDGAEDVPSCVILLRLRTVLKPQNWMVMRSSANGRASYNRVMKLNRAQRRTLRSLALKYATQNLVGALPSGLRQVEAKLKRLPKGHVLGKALKGRRRRSSGGQIATRRTNRSPKGTFLHLKLIPAGQAQLHQSPPPARL